MNSTQSSTSLPRKRLNSTGTNSMTATPAAAPSQQQFSRLNLLYVLKNPREKYTQSTSKVQSRFLDNHIHKPHQNPWMANGITPAYKYSFNDSGLGFQIKDKYQVQMNETRLRISTMREKKEINDFPELRNLKSGDLLIMIEYCSECASHEGSTRHDEQRYLQTAVQLRSSILRQYPIAKVILKPIRVDPISTPLQKLITRQKVGAFEVTAGSNQNGVTKKGCVFSKLGTGRWGTQSEILAGIAKYTGTCTLSFRLNLPYFDSTQLPPGQQLNPSINKIYGVLLTLKPCRDTPQIPLAASQSQQTLNGSFSNRISIRKSSISTIRPQSAMSRPQSGSSLSQRAFHEDQFQRLHHSNSSSQLQVNRRSSVDSMKQKNEQHGFTGKTDKNGVVVFENIPVDSYFVEIQETNNYRRLKQQVNVFDLNRDQIPLDIELLLQQFNKTFLTIAANYFPAKDSSTEIMPLQNATIRIYVMPPPPLKLNNNQSNHKRNEEQEEQLIERPPIIILEEKFNETQSITLEPGVYLVQIEKSGYQQIEELITAVPGEQNIVFPAIIRYIDDDPQSQQGNDPNSRSTRFSKRPSSSTRRGILKSADSSNRTGTSSNINNNINNNNYRINSATGSNRGGYTHVKASESTGEQATFTGERLTSLNNEMLPAQSVTTDSPKVSQNQHPSQQRLHSRPASSHSYSSKKLNSPVKEQYQQQQTEQQKSGQVEEQLIDEWSFDVIQRIKERDNESLKPPKSQNEVKLTGFCTNEIIAIKVITPANELITESQENVIIQNNVKSNKIGLWIKDSSQYSSGVYRIYATILNRQNFNGKQLKMYASQKNEITFISIPNSQLIQQTKSTTWDIGIFDVKTRRFFEINGVCDVPLSRDWLLAEYEQLLKYFNGSRTQLKKILGFEGNGRMTLGSESNNKSRNDDSDVYVRLDSITKSLLNYEFTLSSEMLHFMQSAAATYPGNYISFKKLELKFIHKDLDQFAYSFLPYDANAVVDTTSQEQEDLDIDQAYLEDEEDDEDLANFVQRSQILTNTNQIYE